MNFIQYIKQAWKAGSSGGTPLSPDRLNHMEDGIKNNNDMISALNTTATANKTLLGSTNISSIGGGTVTGAISALNTNIANYNWSNWEDAGTACGIKLLYKYNDSQCMLYYSGKITAYITAFSAGYVFQNFPEKLVPSKNILIPIASNQDGLCLKCYPGDSKKWYITSVKDNVSSSIDTYICGEYIYCLY